MNEVSIKNIIKYKLTAAERMLGKLPPEISNNLKDIGSIILESVNEYSQGTKAQPVNKEKPVDRQNNIIIE